MQHQAIKHERFIDHDPATFKDQMPLHKSNIIAMVLAGGRGERLYPLTGRRAKPAVPFGGVCRLVDFVLSNMVNSGIGDIYVLTQHNDGSLLRYLKEGWTATHFLDGSRIRPVPAHMLGQGNCYLGTADAVYKNRDLIKRTKPDMVLVFGSDHVYCMDVRQMISCHLEKEAEVTVATIPMPVTECSQFGTVVVDDEWRIRQFEEKVPCPTPIPNRPDQALVSIGNYVFDADVLLEELEEDVHDTNSSHDFGTDILPKMYKSRHVYAYDFRTNVISDSEQPTDYWRDVGTIESYYRASMDLNNPLCHLDLYSVNWPLRSANHHALPVKVMEDPYGRTGCVENSIIGSSTVVSGGYVRDSVIGPNVRILSGAVVEESIILGDVIVEEKARIHRTIIDHGSIIGAGARIGYDYDMDSARYYVDKCGVVVVPHNAH